MNEVQTQAKINLSEKLKENVRKNIVKKKTHTNKTKKTQKGK